jgi:hypothetical protein
MEIKSNLNVINLTKTNTNTNAKTFCITFANGQIALYRSGDDDPTIAPDVLTDYLTGKICVKEYVTISQLRLRIDKVNINLKRKISLDAAMNIVFYKEAENVSQLNSHKKVNTTT